MKETKEKHIISHYLCIGCPRGCRLEVEALEDNPNEIVEVRGFSCKRGEVYARQEHIEPRRMVTTTVKINNGIWTRIPVRTVEPISKDKVAELCGQLHKISLKAPVNRGERVLTNVLNTGVDVITSRSMEEKNQ